MIAQLATGSSYGFYPVGAQSSGVSESWRALKSSIQVLRALLGVLQETIGFLIAC